MSVCQTITFEKVDVRKFIFAHAVYLQGIRVKFIYEDHRVEVKVTGAKKVENSYSRNIKLRSAINNSTKHRAVKFACSMGFPLWRIEWCDRHLCHVTVSEHA